MEFVNSSESDDDVNIEIFEESDSSTHSCDDSELPNNGRIVRLDTSESTSENEDCCDLISRNKQNDSHKFQGENEALDLSGEDEALYLPSEDMDLSRDHISDQSPLQAPAFLLEETIVIEEVEDFDRKVVEVEERVKRESIELYRPGSFSGGRRRSSEPSFSSPCKYIKVVKDEGEERKSHGVRNHRRIPKPKCEKKSVSSGTSSIHWSGRLGSKDTKDMSDIGPGSVFDSHCHLDFICKKSKNVNTLEKMLALDGEGMEVYRKGGNGKFLGCIAVACDPRTWGQLPSYAQHGVYFSVGCHPHFVQHFNRDSVQKLESLISGNKRIGNLVALGEIGLDYSAKNKASKTLQKKVFKDQLTLAMKYRLPVQLHIRDAKEDGYLVLREAGVPPSYPLHLHCFSGSWTEAERWMKTFPGSKIGLTGLVTFPDALQVHEVAAKIPLDKILLETDAPYFLPKNIDRAKYQGNLCLPGHVVRTAARIAELRGDDVRNILAANVTNVQAIYGMRFMVQGGGTSSRSRGRRKADK